MHIRTIRESDAEPFVRLRMQLDTETSFMLLEPGERQTTTEEQAKQIQKLLAAVNQTILVAEQGDTLAGFVGAFGGNNQRNRHTAHVVIGILQRYTGQGIGTRLLFELEKWARQAGVHRLELTVMTHNSRALALYQKAGFTVEGTKKHSLFINQMYVDEHLMGKLIT